MLLLSALDMMTYIRYNSAHLIDNGENLLRYVLFWLVGEGIVYGGHGCAMQIDKDHVEANKPLSRNQPRKQACK